MGGKILINAVDATECRIAKVKNSKLEEFHIENASREITHGNIYKGIITRIEPSLQAVFVDYGTDRHGFLQKNEIHSDYYQDTSADNPSIRDIIKQDQELLVQVIKDPVRNKGAVLSTNISLAGRYVVIMPGSENRGISRKIETPEERERLRGIVDNLKVPEGFGVIVRTVGENCTKTLISKDVTYLIRLWKNIKKNVMEVETPSLLHKERNFVLRSIRDYFTSDVSEILIDDIDVFREVKDFIHIISPKHTRIVKQYKSDKPIFTKHQLENQIASIYKNRVILKSGGSIVIEQTEALVAIDVNSGKSTQNRSIEQTAYQTNLEAAEEIARQLRLRDLGGLIVLDLIDMKEQKHRREVEKALKTHVRQDKAKTKIGRISAFGLIEMSRQRIRPSIEFSSFQSCKHCHGKGLIPSPETLGAGFLRKLNLEALKPDITSVKGIVPVEVADYILNKKRKELVDLETGREISISIEGNSAMVPGESDIINENGKSAKE
jgi:ribonuclease E